MIGRFQADGWTAAQTNNWSYNTAQSNVTTAGQVSTKVDQIRVGDRGCEGRHRHPLDGRPVESLLPKNLGGTAKVDEWVSLGGPNHGTSTALPCFWNTSCFEMQPGSSFLNALNSGDETPGARQLRHLVVALRRGDQPRQQRPAERRDEHPDGLHGHSALYSDLTVYGQVRNFID